MSFLKRLNRISYKFVVTVMVVALLAAMPLALYMLYRMQQEKIESLYLNAASNAHLMARSSVDVYLRTGGNLESARIDATETLSTYKRHLEKGLEYAEVILLMPKYRGLSLARLDKSAEKPLFVPELRNSEERLSRLTSFGNGMLAECPTARAWPCYNFSYVARIEKQDLVLGVYAISSEYVEAPIRQVRYVILAVTLLTMAVAVFVGLTTARFITNPVEQLVQGVNRYSKGELETEVVIDARDEMGTLAEAFNRMALEIRRRIQEIEEHRSQLEIRVEERTRDLKDALEQVTQLKEQQDGDYFLTSNLLVPLCVNRSSNDYVKCDFVVRQKKQFRFRKWEGSIGGDICITADLRFLRNGRVEHYTFATNADAMGKSLQGGGGAIVFGTAINTILTTSTAGKRVLQTRPADWLMRVYEELQNIFLSFDGTMLISAVLMLINQHTGEALYINSEHPWTIVVRSGQAEFIENSLHTRKLGILAEESLVSPRRYQLEPGDILIMGSDGRDDVILHTPENESGVMNEDESLFLRHAERGAGDLHAILENIRSQGQLTDDLSLLKVLFATPRPVEEFQPTYELTAHEHVLEILLQVKTHLKQNNPAAAEAQLAAIRDIAVVQNMAEFHYLRARIALLRGELEAAADYTEKAIAIAPENPVLHKLLGQIRLRLRQNASALESFRAALRIREDERIRGLVQHLEAQT